MKELVEKVEQWGVSKSLDTSNPATQVLKVISEFGELADGVAKQDKSEVADAAGDVTVTVILSHYQLDIKFEFVESDNLYTIADATHALADIVEIVDIIIALREDEINHFAVERYERRYKEKCQVVLNFASQVANDFGFTLEETLEIAYNVIKNRTGYTNENGTFIKDED